MGWTMGGSWQAVGGSGRFDGASGYGWVGGLGDVGQNTEGARYSFRGNIEYDTSAPAE